YTYNTPASNTLWATVILLAVGLLVAFWILHRWLGYRRLTQPTGQKTLSTSIAESIEQPYRPPMMHNLQRPSVRRALLWQQYRQIGWVLFTLTALGVTAALTTNLVRNHDLNSFLQAIVEIYSALGVVIAGLGLGAIVFYGDNVNRRLAFFADRGISPGKVWWTRMLLPLAACLLIASVAAMVTYGWRTNSDRYLWLVIPGLFASGQVVSMWMSRPILSIFASPVYAMLLAIPMTLFYDYYRGYGWTAVFAIPILLFTTWWLCKRWLSGDTGKTFHTRMVLMTTLAILLPIASVLTHRIASTPALNRSWRANAMAETMDTKPAQSTGTHGINNAIYFINQWGTRVVTHDLNRNYETLEEVKEAIQSEMDTESTRGPVSNDDMAMIFDPVRSGWNISREEHIALRRQTMKLALTRIHRMRQSAVAGLTDLDDLQAIAEIPEVGAVRLLSADPDLFGNAEEVRELVAMIPSDQLRRESRIKTLLGEWRRYQHDYPRSIQTASGVELPRQFMGMQLSSPGILGIEQRRSDRYLDEAVRVLWEQLRTGLPVNGSEAYNRRVALWRNAISPDFWQWGDRGRAFDSWTREHELSVQQLRERYSIP
ncbi:MAG: hypothetical protein WBD20_05585, partial [Pirellulaceae bacterium]